MKGEETLPVRTPAPQKQAVSQSILCLGAFVSQGLKMLVAESAAPQPCNRSSNAAPHTKPFINLNNFYTRGRKLYFFWSDLLKTVCEEAKRRLIDTSK